MKIAIAGTRGIPNNYGGFEQCAEYLSVLLAARGHDVTVYNTHYHPYSETFYRGVKVKHVWNPELTIGTAGNFIYDYLCMRDAIKNKADILLVLGYTTASVFFPFMGFGRSVVVTNMDGLEWKRDKWSDTVKKLALWFEKLGAKHSNHLVSDNEKIREYLLNAYGKDSTFIPYGCEPFTKPDASVLSGYGVTAGAYSIVIARMEAENNIDMVLEGYRRSRSQDPILVVGNMVTAYATMLSEKYGNDKRIRFMGGIYNQDDLNNLRHHAKYYFHGHSVGGTNPSLLEAMASPVYVVAHGNEFNRSVLGPDASFFMSADEVCSFVDSFSSDDRVMKAIQSNLKKVREQYNWNAIADQYESLFRKVLAKHEK
jgi:glycosyltransferase involved in cell wall biosynthesis